MRALGSVSEGTKNKYFKEVHIHYGPYNLHGITIHRTHRLQGLTKLLTAYGHKVILQPISFLNLVELWVHEKLVFSMDILDLDFGGDGQMDCMCERALKEVQRSF